MEQQAEPTTVSSKLGSARGTLHPLPALSSAEQNRLPLGSAELNRVLGGGIVPGSVILLGGDPGIGKSTLLLQAAQHVAESGRLVLYVAAEESPEQIKLRADRLQVRSDRIVLFSESTLDRVLDRVEDIRPSLLIVDSVQTIFLSHVLSSPGSVTQLRDCTAQLVQYAKRTGTPVFLVGHVTKEGMIAGPRVVEHMVDVVLYLEGERFHHYRILRAVKNRFGSTNEIGVFEMTDQGLLDIRSPSELFLAERIEEVPGSAVIVTMEGTRPLLIEVQALTAPTGYGAPRRVATGFDGVRLQVLVAVLMKHAGLRLADQDVFINVTGGLRVVEPAADLGVAVAIASSSSGIPLDPSTVYIGEVGLAGEVRGVQGLERRLQEAARLGFARAVIPNNQYSTVSQGSPLLLQPVRTLAEAISGLAVRAIQEKRDSSVHLARGEE